MSENELCVFAKIYHLSSKYAEVFQPYKYVLMVNVYPIEIKVKHHIDRQQG